MTTELRIVQHKRGWCTMGVPHDPHPYQVLNNTPEFGPPRWDDYWCSGFEPPDDELGQMVVVLFDDDCWCQDPDQLQTRMSAAIAHVLEKVREIVYDGKEDDTWMDRWGIEQSREIIPVDDLLRELDKLQHTEEEETDEP
jgi:hypothetical protein